MGQVTQQYVVCVSALGVLAAKSAHRVTGVATFILLADIGNQRLWTLHFDFKGGDQRVFRVNDNVSRFPLNFITDRNCTCALSDFQQNVAHVNRLVFESFLIGVAGCTAWGLFGIANETVPPQRRRGTRCITVQVNESGVRDSGS